MRRPPRLLAVLVVTAAAATACADVSPEEQTLLEAASDSIDQEMFGFDDPDDDPDDDPGDGPDDEPDEGESWLDDDIGEDAERAGPRPEIRQFRCPFERDLVTSARCGKIDVPGRGADPDYQLEIAFTRFSATGDDADKQPDPVVYLHGGPGGSILDSADFWYETIVAPHIENRDVILYDQRGGGMSSPLPLCREAGLSTDDFYTAHATHESLRDEFLTSLEGCAARLQNRSDVDFTAFNSAANAQDFVDLMWALGIDEFNLHGSSYGTRLAQTIMRDAPDGVRSVVLSGTYPLDANLMGSIPGSLESSLTAVFDGCAASELCGGALPDPWSALETLVEELDNQPLLVETPTSASATFTLAFDGTDLLNGLHSILYANHHAATVPDLLIDWLDGDTRRIERLAQVSIFDHADVAAFVLVQCSDEGAFTTEDLLNRPLQHEFLRAIDLAPSLNGVDSLTICEAWDTGVTDPVENEPVSWDAPTLLLAGAVDPITPPHWAAELASRLPRGRLVDFADFSHDSDEGWCATSLIAEFVDRPDVLLDTSCAANVPEMWVNDRAERFGGPFESIDQTYDFDVDGETVEFPAPPWSGDWRDDARIMWRALDELDPTALILLDVGSSYDTTEHLGSGIFVPDWELAPRGGIPAGWTRSVIDSELGLLVSYAHETSGVELVLVIERDETEDLERAVLVPAAAAIGADS